MRTPAFRDQHHDRGVASSTSRPTKRSHGDVAAFGSLRAPIMLWSKPTKQGEACWKASGVDNAAAQPAPSAACGNGERPPAILLMRYPEILGVGIASAWCFSFVLYRDHVCHHQLLAWAGLRQLLDQPPLRGHLCFLEGPPAFRALTIRTGVWVGSRRACRPGHRNLGQVSEPCLSCSPRRPPQSSPHPGAARPSFSP